MRVMKNLIVPVVLLLSACSHLGEIALSLKMKDGKPLTWEQAENLRRLSPVSENTLINGDPVDKKKWAAIVRIRSESGSGCTAQIIGPRMLVTAAHCAKTGERVQFTTIHGSKYAAKIERHPDYPGTDIDVAVGFIDRNVQGIDFLHVRSKKGADGAWINDRFERTGMEVQILGYGCTRPGGGGGNDGVLRTGVAKVQAGQKFDLITGDGAALCFGDSGGAVVYPPGNAHNDGTRLIGINSKGNIKDTNYTLRLTLPSPFNFLKDMGKKYGADICGVNSACGTEEEPPKQDPKSFVIFENDEFMLMGKVKGD